MNSPTSLAFWRTCAAVLLATAAPAAAYAADIATPAPAEAGNSGTLTGRVLNPATGQYLARAEVRIQGTGLVAVTEPDGTFRFPRVPAGPAVLTFSYTGMTTLQRTVEVRPGGTATLEVELEPVRALASGEVLKLGAFVVSTEREGNAKAIMEQRNSMNLTNSVSSDHFGDVAEGNVGEFLKNMPGVDLEYVGPDSRGARLRGLDPEYVGVSIDGMSMASGDALQGTGASARSFSLDQVSLNNIDRIEVNYTSSADMDANAPAGTINMKTKRAFERKGRRIAWQLNFMANGDDLTFDRTYGPGDKKSHKLRPGGIVEYSDVLFSNRLGVVLNLSLSNQYALQRRTNYTYNTAATPADPRPRVITGLAFWQQPKYSERFTPTLTLDFKATQSLVLSLTAMYNWYDTFFDSRQAIFAATGRAVVTGDGMGSFDVINGGGSLSLAQNHSHKIVRTRTVTPKFEFRRDNLTVDGALNYSISTNQYQAMTREGPVNMPMNAVSGLNLRLSRPELDEGKWTITQTGGPDFADLSLHTNPRVNEEARFAEDEIVQGQLNARLTLDWRLPTWIKVGGKLTEQYRRFRNPNPALTYRYDGPGGGTAGSFAAYAFPDYRWEMGPGVRITSISGLPPIFPNRPALGDLFIKHPEYFTDVSTPANFYTAYIANPRNMNEQFTAGYAMANTRVRQLQLQGGLRWEETGFEVRQFQARTAAEMRAAGFAVAAANGRATTVPGLVYQFMSLPKTTRSSRYDNLFPTASAKLEITRQLQAHLGYSSTISRPAFNNLSGVWVFNETAQTVNVPNPNLLPERSRNFTGRLAYYFEPVGSLAVTAFQNSIRDSAEPGEFSSADFGYANDPAYAGYTFISARNLPGITRVRGYTFEYSQALSFLPGLLRGLNVSSSYTRTYASVTKSGMVPHMISGTLSYRYRRASFGITSKWTDATPYTGAVLAHRRARNMIDLNGGWQWSPKTSLFFHVRNLFDVSEHRYQGDPGITTYNAGFGTILTLGVKGTF